jgi:tetratricopeptide (TPR) repeat protein
MIDYILIAVGTLSLAGIIYLISKKANALSRSSVLSPKQHKEIRTKERLIAKRLERKFSKVGSVVSRYGKPAATLVQTGSRRLYTTLQDLEARYHRRSLNNTLGESQASGPALVKLNPEVSTFLNNEDYKAAEKKLIEMVSLDPMNPETYRKLGELYVESKQYDLAKETYQYVITLVKRRIDQLEVNDGSMNIQLAADYMELGHVFQSTNDQVAALNYFEHASKLDRNNPKNLDHLLEASLATKNKVLAWEAFDRLKEVNADNQKLPEYEQAIKQLESETKRI